MVHEGEEKVGEVGWFGFSPTLLHASIAEVYQGFPFLSFPFNSLLFLCSCCFENMLCYKVASTGERFKVFGVYFSFPSLCFVSLLCLFACYVSS